MALTITLAALAVTSSAADVTGTWKAEFDTQIGVQKYTFELEQDGDTVSGTALSEIQGEKRETVLRDGKVEGDTISFIEMLPFQGNQRLNGYLKEHDVPDVWNVDGHAHDAAHWRNNLYHFLQQLFQ